MDFLFSPKSKISKKLILFVILILAVMEGVGYLIGLIVRYEKDIMENEEYNFKRLIFENLLLKKRINSLKPNGVYIIVDTADNILYLKENNKTLLKAIISAGSGNILIDPSGKKEWIFETPRGIFTVRSKFERPSWIKPDWAFIEEGKPIPKNFSERIEEGVLGEYAIGLGHGYFIHGTLYKRLLGKNVTHGCIRLGDKELKTVYELTPIGAKVIIF